jgi:hypothetical protein
MPTDIQLHQLHSKTNLAILIMQMQTITIAIRRIE